MDTPEPSLGRESPQHPALTPPLPEAPASVNVRLMLHGREVQMTFRDADEGRLLHAWRPSCSAFPWRRLPPGRAAAGGLVQSNIRCR